MLDLHIIPRDSKLETIIVPGFPRRSTSAQLNAILAKSHGISESMANVLWVNAILVWKETPEEVDIVLGD